MGSLMSLFVHPRHGAFQTMIEKERRWSAKFIAAERERQHESGVAATGVSRAHSSGALVASGAATVDAADLGRQGCPSQTAAKRQQRLSDRKNPMGMLPASTNLGPSIYYTGSRRSQTGQGLTWRT